MERRIVSWNRACEELYGFTTEEVIGKRVPELISFEYPDYTREEVFEEVFAKDNGGASSTLFIPKQIKRFTCSAASASSNHP